MIDKKIFNHWLTTKFIAHRGLHDGNVQVPENSLLALRKAVEKKYAIEIDVQPDKNHMPIVFHDKNLCRMTGVNRILKKESFENISNLNLKNTDQKIPTLEQALKVINSKVPIILEVKNTNYDEKFEKNIKTILRKYKGEFVISSFNPYIVKWFKFNMPDIYCGQVSSLFKDESKMNFLQKRLVGIMIFNKQINPDFISYQTGYIPNRWLKKWYSKPILAWTVKSQAEQLRVSKFCDNIIFERYSPLK